MNQLAVLRWSAGTAMLNFRRSCNGVPLARTFTRRSGNAMGLRAIHGAALVRARSPLMTPRLMVPATQSLYFRWLSASVAVPAPPPGSANTTGDVSTKAAEGGAIATIPAPAEAARNYRAVGYWLLATAGAVFVMIVLGGVTRLTRSGLSIVEWRPQGEALPSSQAEWEAAFEAYKQFPEYKKVNRSMTLEEFKPIYWMEWGHRQWGRAIGLLFAGPLVYFVASRRLPAGMAPRLGALLALGAAQGGIGWWMVKSGLDHDAFRDEWQVPRVSPYRLATHLGFAFSLYSLLLWFGMDALAKARALASAPTAVASSTSALSADAVAAARRLRPAAMAVASVICLTVASGAFVAGNDAGHAYNDWPLFAGHLIPETIWEPALGSRNIFENTATVQFDHRMLAYSSIAAVGVLHGAIVRAGGSSVVPRPILVASRALGGLVLLQATLGVSTLVLYVPVHLAAAHQAGAVALLSGAIAVVHAVHRAVVAGGERATLGAVTGSPAARRPVGAATPSAAAAVAAASFFLQCRPFDGGRRQCYDVAPTVFR